MNFTKRLVLGFLFATAMAGGALAGEAADGVQATTAATAFAPGIFVTADGGARLRRLDDMTFRMKDVEKGHWVAVRMPEGGASVLVDGSRDGLFVSDKHGRGYALIVSGEARLVSSRREFRVVNRSGVVLVTRDGHWQPLPTGRVFVTTGAADHLDSVLPAPSLVNGASGFVEIASESVDTASPVCWSALDGAVRYAVQVTDERGASVTELTVPGAATCADLPMRAAGAYDVSVAAVDATGVVGLSARTTLRRVRVTVPPGSFIDEQGGVHLARGHSATLEGAQGLELSATGNVWVPSRGTVSATPSRTLRYRLRAPGSEQHAELVVSTRNDRLDVVVGPKNAEWPADDVVVSIAPTRDQQASPAWVEPTAVVRVGVDVVPVEWKRVDGTLRAIVPRPKGAGPWVVRVDVHDQHGVSLGRDFVEVRSSASPAGASPVALGGR